MTPKRIGTDTAEDDEASRADDSLRSGTREPTPVGKYAAQIMADLQQRIEAGEFHEPPVPDLEREKVEARDRYLIRMMDRGIPRDAAEILYDGLATTSALELVQRFMNGQPGTLALSGGVGCGKTVAAAWAVAQKARERYLGSSPDGRNGIWPADLHPRFIDSGTLLWIPQFGKESEQQLRPLRSCALLAIDDVGTVDGVVRFVDALVVTRHNNRLRTIITTNLPAEQFHKIYGLRVRDRLRGSKMGGFHEINEESRR